MGLETFENECDFERVDVYNEQFQKKKAAGALDTARKRLPVLNV